MNTPSHTQPGTAIVTGASSGIGKIYAERLASRGHDIVLVARRQDRLLKIAADLGTRFGVKVDILTADLSTPSGLELVSARIEDDATVTFLVNNAGFSILKPLTETPARVIDEMITVNVTALTVLSKAALVNFKKRGRGTLINIGSGAGIAAYPGIPVYGATKAYVALFTRSLQSEVDSSSVRIQLVLPGAVVSEGWDVAGGADLDPLPQSIVMTTEDCVDAALAGLDLGETVTAPSLQDETMLKNHEALSNDLMSAMFDQNPAPRYRLPN